MGRYSNVGRSDLVEAILETEGDGVAQIADRTTASSRSRLRLRQVGAFPLRPHGHAVRDRILGAQAVVVPEPVPRLGIVPGGAGRADVVPAIGVVRRLDAGQGRHEHGTDRVAERGAEAKRIARLLGSGDRLVVAAPGDGAGHFGTRRVLLPVLPLGFDAENEAIAEREAVGDVDGGDGALGREVQVVDVAMALAGGGAEGDTHGQVMGHGGSGGEQDTRSSSDDRDAIHWVSPVE